MSIGALYKYVEGSTYTVTNEPYSSMGSTTFQLGTVKRAFKGGTNIVIVSGATTLVEGIDYTLENEDKTYTDKEGFTVYTGVKLINAAYYAESLTISYKALGSYTDPVSFSDQVPVGAEFLYGSEVLPSSGFYQWKEGASLLRANYPMLFARYYVNRGSVTITEANPGVVTLNSHGFGTASCISLATTGTLPTNLAINTNYYVIYVNANTFRLATSANNARAGTAINTTGAISAGVHTLYSNPHGINGADSFYLPDGDGLVMRQTGDLTINGRTKTGVGLGAAEEDGTQGGQVGAAADATGARNYWGRAVDRNFVNGAGVLANYAWMQIGTALQGGANMLKLMDDGTNGPRRDGVKNQENTMGVRYIVRVI